MYIYILYIYTLTHIFIVGLTWCRWNGPFEDLPTFGRMKPSMRPSRASLVKVLISKDVHHLQEHMMESIRLEGCLLKYLRILETK